MHVDFQSANDEKPKCKNYTLEYTLEELQILKIMVANPHVTQRELAQELGKSERTIKSKVLSLQEKNYVRRVNGKRYGRWEVLVEI